jgi:hypothetical protein
MANAKLNHVVKKKHSMIVCASLSWYDTTSVMVFPRELGASKSRRHGSIYDQPFVSVSLQEYI